MQKLIGITFVGVLLLTASGCSNRAKAEKVVEEMLSILQQFNDTLASVKDKDSAKAAASKLDQLGQQIKALAEKNKDLKITKDDEKYLEEKFKPKFDEIGKTLSQNGMKAGLASMGEPTFMKALQNFGASAQEAQNIMKANEK